MSIKMYDKSGSTPQEILLAGISSVDQILNGTSKNAIANKAVFNALKEKIDKTVSDLINYYSKSDVYNKAEVRALISTISTMDIQVVNALPTEDISTTTIYFLKPAGATTYDEYVYINNAWVKIGTTDLDLSQYVTNDALTLRLADYYTKAEITTLLTQYAQKDNVYDKDAVDALLDGFYTKSVVDGFLNNKPDIEDAFVKRYTTTETDMDNLYIMGAYTINPSVTTDNVPESSSWALVEVYAHGNTTATTASVVQTWYGLNGNTYSRTRGGSPLAWTSWKTVGNQDLVRLGLEDIVADDPTVVDMQTLIDYILVNYGVKKSSYAQYYRIWVTAISSDERYTACAQSLSDVYGELIGVHFNFAELLIQREAGNCLKCQLRPFVNGYPNANIVYWNSNGSWSSDRPMNQNSGWYLDGGLGVIELGSSQDLNDIVKPSLYLQGSSVNATSAHHYPCGISGILEVQRVASNLIVQKYRPSSSIDYATTFIRRQYGGTWSDWMSDDYVILGSVTAQSITTSGITVNIPYSLALKCREFACQAYGLLLMQDYHYAASGYMSIAFIHSNGNRYRLYWANNSATTATLYLDNSAGTTIAGNIPALYFLGKLGRNLPTVFH